MLNEEEASKWCLILSLLGQPARLFRRAAARYSIVLERGEIILTTTEHCKFFLTATWADEARSEVEQNG